MQRRAQDCVRIVACYDGDLYVLHIRQAMRRNTCVKAPWDGRNCGKAERLPFQMTSCLLRAIRRCLAISSNPLSRGYRQMRLVE